MNSEIKNLLTAVILSTFILVAWQYFVIAPQQEQIKKEQKLAEKKKISAEQIPNVSDAIIQEGAELTREEALGNVQRIKIETSKVSGSISLKGARIDDLIVKGYKKVLNGLEDVEFLSPSGSDNVHFATFGWVSSDKNQNLPDKDTVWSLAPGFSGKLTPNNPLKLIWGNGKGLLFSKTIEIDENYMFRITQKVTNTKVDPITVPIAPYGLINRTKVPYQDFFISHEGPIGVLDGILDIDNTFNDLLDSYEKGEKESFKNVKGWFGMGDKYWLSAFVPNESFNLSYSYNVVNNIPRFQVEYIGNLYDLAPQNEITASQHFYAGPKIVSLLDQYEENLNIPMFDHAIDFGWFYFLTRPISIALNYFNGFLGNFGLAILLLTVFIKLLLFPLANKGYIAMNKLKALTPELTKLRERYKDDKIGLQREMMALYKKEKVNPMSGCMPILIQLPIFFSLYKVLFISIEMRHAPFYGWIKDLSAPDPTTIFNLFGLFDYSVPGILMIGIWPCLMALTMILQQMLNPPPPDPVQAKVIKALPFVFVFLFAQFPAGLIIYWAWSNTLSIIQQWVISRVLPAKQAKKTGN